MDDAQLVEVAEALPRAVEPVAARAGEDHRVRHVAEIAHDLPRDGLVSLDAERIVHTRLEEQSRGEPPVLADEVVHEAEPVGSLDHHGLAPEVHDLLEHEAGNAVRAQDHAGQIRHRGVGGDGGAVVTGGGHHHLLEAEALRHRDGYGGVAVLEGQGGVRSLALEEQLGQAERGPDAPGAYQGRIALADGEARGGIGHGQARGEAPEPIARRPEGRGGRARIARIYGLEHADRALPPAVGTAEEPRVEPAAEATADALEHHAEGHRTVTAGSDRVRDPSAEGRAAARAIAVFLRSTSKARSGPRASGSMRSGNSPSFFRGASLCTVS